MNLDRINAAKAALNIPSGPLPPEQMGDAMVKLAEWFQANPDPQEVPSPASQTGDDQVGSEASPNSAPSAGKTDAAQAPFTCESHESFPSADKTNGPESSILQEELAAQLSGYFGQSELVFVEPNDPRIPVPLQINAQQASALNWRLPDVVAGVVCGRSPQPLQAIVFTDVDQLGEFNKENPALKDSTITLWPREPSSATGVLWLRCSSGISRNVSCGAITWAATGIVPVGVPTIDAKYFLSQEGPIACVRFSEIKWPPGVEEMFLIPRLEQLFGSRYIFAKGRKIILNTTFWANLIAKRTGVAFIVDENAFYAPDNGKAVLVTDEDMLIIVMTILRETSAVDRGFPIAALRPAAAKQILEEMKLAAAKHRPGQKETLAEFLELRLERRYKHSLTVEEIYLYYCQYCQELGHPRYMPLVFTRAIGPLVKQKYGLLKSHDLLRTGSDGKSHARRGFHGLRLKGQDQSTPTDSPDAADGTDATTQRSKNEVTVERSAK